MTSQTVCCKKLWYFNKVSSKHNLTFLSTSVNIPLVPIGTARFFLFISDDNFVPALFHTPALPVRRHWQHSQTNAAVYCETHCDMVTASLAFGFGGHLDLKKTTSWNYLSAPSHSVYIVLASCADAARQPGCFSWSGWLLAAAPPLATSLSAPSSSVFIVSGSGAGAAELAPALSAAAWAPTCLCCISSTVDSGSQICTDSDNML